MMVRLIGFSVTSVHPYFRGGDHYYLSSSNDQWLLPDGGTQDMTYTNWGSGGKTADQYAWARLSDDHRWYSTDGIGQAIVVCMVPGNVLFIYLFIYLFI
jgi:hypothetical protein